MPAALATNRAEKKSANRQKLIEAAIGSIAEVGLTETTVGRVVARAGLSRGIVNLQFETKEALLAEALRFLNDEWRAAWRAHLERAGPDPAARLQALVLSVFEPRLFNRRKLSAWHAFYADAKYQAIYRDIMAPSDKAYLDTLTGLCRALIAGGDGQGLEARLVAKGLRCMTDGLCLDWVTVPRGAGRAEARRICLQALRTSFPRSFPLAGRAEAEGTAA